MTVCSTSDHNIPRTADVRGTDRPYGRRYQPQRAPGYNKWQLRPGSGTGELTNLVSGSGEVTWTVHALGLVGGTPVEGEGDLTGTITCRV